MGLLNNLRESILRVRVVPKQTPEDLTNFSNEKQSLPNKMKDAEESGKRIDLTDLLNVNKIRGDRNTKYSVFEEMVADGRIGAAVEMYANDTVQYDPKGRIIWIEAKDSDVSAYCNKLINDLNIADNLWSYAYQMWLYGDVYLETFENTSNSGNKPSMLLEPTKYSANVATQKNIAGAKLERYVEKVDNPADIYDLQYKGKTSGYVRTRKSLTSNFLNNSYIYEGNVTNLDILNPTKFVHICLSPNINRYPEKFNLIRETDQEKVMEDGSIDGSSYEGSGSTLSFTVKSGQSVLENVYSSYQTLKLKEDSVLLERVTKSSIIRVIQVELGDLPESQKRKKLQEIKNQIEQQMIINKDEGTMQSRSGAQPTENILYTTTKNGKGTISTVNIGGDAEIGTTDDITQSENKLYGSLLVPKALLGADMEGSGLSNGGSLTEMNTTYARRIKRGQVALATGIKNLINIFALSENNLNVVNNFEVKLTPIITVEDNRRDDLLQTKIRNVNELSDLIKEFEEIPSETRLDAILEWMSKYLNQQDIVDIINKALQKKDKEEQTKNIDNQLEEIGADYEHNDFIDDNGDVVQPDDMDKNIDEEQLPDDTVEPVKPELSSQENIANIEGEDLL